MDRNTGEMKDETLKFCLTFSSVAVGIGPSVVAMQPQLLAITE
jgi:hypothetical protein